MKNFKTIIKEVVKLDDLENGSTFRLKVKELWEREVVLPIKELIKTEYDKKEDKDSFHTCIFEFDTFSIDSNRVVGSIIILFKDKESIQFNFSATLDTEYSYLYMSSFITSVINNTAKDNHLFRSNSQYIILQSNDLLLFEDEDDDYECNEDCDDCGIESDCNKE